MSNDRPAPQSLPVPPPNKPAGTHDLTVCPPDTDHPQPRWPRLSPKSCATACFTYPPNWSPAVPAQTANPTELAMGQSDRERIREDRRDPGARLSERISPTRPTKDPRRTATRKRQPGRRHTHRPISRRPQPTCAQQRESGTSWKTWA